jgi:hypothetical protein
MIAIKDVKPIEVGPSLSVDEAISPKNSLGGKPEGEGAVEIYCTVCGQPATDGRFTGYGPNMQWWYTITGTLDEIQWFIRRTGTIGTRWLPLSFNVVAGTETPACNPMKWSVRQIPAS